MKLIIVVPDLIAHFDGVVIKLSPFTTNVHALHWDDNLNKGSVEYVDKPGHEIDSLDPFEQLVEHVLDAKTEADFAQAELEDEAAARADDPLNKRRNEYPSVEEQLHACYLDRTGNPVPLQQIDAAMLATDAKYPLS